MKAAEMYSMEHKELNERRVLRLAEDMEKCKSWESFHELQSRKYWMNAAFFHGAKDQFEWAKKTLDTAEDKGFELLMELLK